MVSEITIRILVSPETKVMFEQEEAAERYEIPPLPEPEVYEEFSDSSPKDLLELPEPPEEFEKYKLYEQEIPPLPEE
jgi:hypothetical protein